jgi:hypothetical protein
MYKIRGADQREYEAGSADQLRQWIVEGRANAQTLAQGPDSTEWKPLGTFPEFAGLFSSIPAPSPAAGYPAGPAPGGLAANVPSYLGPAIAVTVCCCPPFGVPAIVFAAQVNSKLAAGDIAGAMDASKKAKVWCWIAFGLGILGGLISFIIQVASGALASLNQ